MSDQTQYGAVIVFPKHMTEDQVQDILSSLYNEGDIERVNAVRKFDPNYGGPVWYVP